MKNINEEISNDPFLNRLISSSKEKQVESIKSLMNLLNISDKDLKEKQDKNTEQIPVDVFNKDLGCLETMVKYLKENKGFSFVEIAKILNRNSKSMWISYRNSKKKHPNKFVNIVSDNYISTNIFCDPILSKLSVQENIVLYLKDELNLGYKKISEILERDYKTIWTVYNKAKKKKKRGDKD